MRGTQLSGRLRNRAPPIDLHIDGLKRLGVSVRECGDSIYCDGKNMKAGDVCLDFPSVGATENLIMASVFLEGNTVIRNAAKEPEIRDLAGFINMLGGKVYGAGTDTVCVQGVKKSWAAYTDLCRTE